MKSCRITRAMTTRSATRVVRLATLIVLIAAVASSGSVSSAQTVPHRTSSAHEEVWSSRGPSLAAVEVSGTGGPVIAGLAAGPKHSSRPYLARWVAGHWRPIVLPTDDDDVMPVAVSGQRGAVLVTGTRDVGVGTRPWAAHCTATGCADLELGGGVAPSTELLGAALTQAQDGWAVGDFLGSDGTVATVLALHGSRLTTVKLPGLPRPSLLYAVAAAPSGDAWAVGQGPGARPLVEQWDGSSWTAEILRNVSGVSPLTGVTVSTSGRVCAVGIIDPNQRTTSSFVECLHGRTWRRYLPGGLTRFAALSVAFRSCHLIVGGYRLTSPGDTASVYASSSGRWIRQDLPDVEPFSSISGVAVGGDRIAWAVGYGTEQGPLAYRAPGNRWRNTF